MSSEKWQYSLYHNIWKGLDVLFPPFCGGCGNPGSRWCVVCRDSVKILDGKICRRCSLPLETGGVCSNCMANPPRFRALRAWARYEGPIRHALHRLKYKRDIGLGESLAEHMVPFVRQLDWCPDLILPVPLSKRRLRERGYNQVTMVARPLASALGVPFSTSILIRQKETRSQVGLNREERRRNMDEAFSMNEPVDGRVIVLMDDISTTGATLSSAAGTMYQFGAKEVFAITVARALRLEQV